MNLQTLNRKVNSILSSITGEYTFVIKTEQGTIQTNENIKMLAASTMKIPIMIEAFRQIASGDLNPSEKIKLTQDQIVGGCGVLQGFSKDASLPLIDVIHLMITVSDNTATNAVLRKVGFEKVNQWCESIGCTDTRMERYFMDIKAQRQGKENTTSARDMVTILEYLHTASPQNEEMMAILENQQFNHKLAAYHKYKMEEKVKIAHKTGEIPGAEHDVGIFQSNVQIVYVAVMTHKLANNVAGQQAIAEVGKAVMEYMVGEKF